MRALLCAAVILLAGCMTGLQNFRDDALKRAAFEMSCSENELNIEPLNEAATGTNWRPGGGIIGAQIGVTGCGKKVVYVRTADAWVANTAVPKTETK